MVFNCSHSVVEIILEICWRTSFESMVLREVVMRKSHFDWKDPCPLADHTGKIFSTFLCINFFSLKHPVSDLFLYSATGNKLTTLFERQCAGSLIKSDVSQVSCPCPTERHGPEFCTLSKQGGCSQSRGAFAWLNLNFCMCRINGYMKQYFFIVSFTFQLSSFRV